MVSKLIDEIKAGGVGRILISEILSRGKFKYSRELTLDRFNAQKNKINKKLKAIANASVVSMSKIKYPQDFCCDQVHLGESGQRKLFFFVYGQLSCQ